MFLLFLLTLSISLYQSYASDIIQLTEKDFHSKLSPLQLVLVKFYAPWCGHCKALAPHFEEAASKLAEGGSPAFLAKVDCTENNDLCSKYEVSGYPTLKLFEYGKFSYDYDGERTSDKIVEYLQLRSLPTSTVFTNSEELDEIIKSDRHIVIGFFENGSKLEDAFVTVAKSHFTYFKFSYTNSLMLSGNNGLETIKLYVPRQLHNVFEENIYIYNGSDNSAELKSWIIDNAFGACGLRDKDNFNLFTHTPTVIVYMNVDLERDRSSFVYWRNRILKTIKNTKTSLHFAISDSSSFPQEVKDFTSDYSFTRQSPLATIKIDGKKFALFEDFSVDRFKKFLNDFEAGLLEPHIISEPIPENNADPIKKVVAKSFQKDVFDVSKDVFIEFFAPWCGHCKKLQPKYNELAIKLSNEPKILIAAMDATANDVPEQFSVSGFPTLFWIPMNSKMRPVRYEGKPETDDMLKFIAAKSTDELIGYDRLGSPKKTEL